MATSPVYSQVTLPQISAFTLSIALAMPLTACARSSSNTSNAVLLAPQTETKGSSIVCHLNGQASVPSFAVAGIGGPGVPRLSVHDASLARAIMRYVDTPTLRFAIVGKQFVVFDAVAGPCSPQAPGYFDLAGGCNDYYTPPLDIRSVHGEPDCLYPPRPWIPHDQGLGTWSWSDYAKYAPGALTETGNHVRRVVALLVDGLRYGADKS